MQAPKIEDKKLINNAQKLENLASKCEVLKKGNSNASQAKKPPKDFISLNKMKLQTPITRNRKIISKVVNQSVNLSMSQSINKGNSNKKCLNYVKSNLFLYFIILYVYTSALYAAAESSNCNFFKSTFKGIKCITNNLTTNYSLFVANNLILTFCMYVCPSVAFSRKRDFSRLLLKIDV